MNTYHAAPRAAALVVAALVLVSAAAGQVPGARSRARPTDPASNDPAALANPGANPGAGANPADPANPPANPRYPQRGNPYALPGRTIPGQQPAQPQEPPPAEDLANPVNVAGLWKGVYSVYPTVMLAELELKTAADGKTLTGELRFVTVPPPPPPTVRGRAAPPPVEGSWRVQGKFDQWSHTLSLLPGGWVKPPAPLVAQPQPMAAVLCVSRNELAGEFEKPGFAPGYAPGNAAAAWNASRLPGFPGYTPPSPGAGAAGNPGAGAPANAVVYTPSSGTAEHTDMPFFLFARADGPDGADVTARMKTLAEHAAAATPLARPAARVAAPAPAPGADVLMAWGDKYEKEYPGNAKSVAIGQLGFQALPLLNDANFKPVFGDSYDTIDADKLITTINLLNGLPSAPGRPAAAPGRPIPRVRPPGSPAPAPGLPDPGLPSPPVAADRPDPRLARDYGYLIYVARPASTRVVAAAAMRTLDAWEEESMSHLRNDPPSAGTFYALSATQKAIKDRLAYMFPSDMKRVDEAFEQMRRDLAGGMVLAKVDQAIATSQGLTGAQALAAWAKNNEALLRFANPGDRAVAQQRIDAQLDKTLTQEIGPALTQLDKLGSGSAAVSAGAAWYKALMKQFGFAAGRPPVQGAIAKLASRRDGDLTAGRDGLLQRINAASNSYSIDTLFATDLGVPGDHAAHVYPALASAADQRKKQIAHDELMAMFSKDEQAIMDFPGHLNLAKAKPGPPSAEEIRLALVRGFAFGSGKMIDAHTARYVSSSQTFLIPYPVILTFSDEKRVDWAQVPNTNDYQCSFTVKMKMTIADDNILANYDRETHEASQKMADYIAGLNNTLGTGAQTFRLYPDGWGVPELRQAGAQEGALGVLFPIGKH